MTAAIIALAAIWGAAGWALLVVVSVGGADVRRVVSVEGPRWTALRGRFTDEQRRDLLRNVVRRMR